MHTSSDETSLAVPVLLHPQELFQVRDEQRSRRAELSPEFPLSSHPHVFYILSMDLGM